jgi:hypothetical protein
VGDTLGLAVGLAVGLSVGDKLGLAVGLAVGLSVGDTLGLAVGVVVVEGATVQLSTERQIFPLPDFFPVDIVSEAALPHFRLK